MEYRLRSHQLLVGAALVFSIQELGFASLGWKDRPSGSAGAWRPGALDRFAALHQTAGFRKLVDQFRLGTEPQHGDTAQYEFLPGRERSSDRPRKFPDRPRGARRQGRTFSCSAGDRRAARSRLREHVPDWRIHNRIYTRYKPVPRYRN